MEMAPFSLFFPPSFHGLRQTSHFSPSNAQKTHIAVSTHLSCIPQAISPCKHFLLAHPAC